jgi:hypothetical protein
MSHCLWNTSEDRHNYHLVNWKQIYVRKEFGGLGVPSIRRYASDKDKI